MFQQASRSAWFAVLLAALPVTFGAGVQMGAQPGLSSTLHEPVIAELILWNTTPDVAEIETGQAGEVSYRVTVTRPNGELVTAGRPRWSQAPETIAELQMTRIGPAQSYTRPLLLNEWFPFDEVDRYEVSVARPGVEGVAYFEVDVSPRDEGRLRSTCARLAADAGQPVSPDLLFAARALSFVSDDLAIPYLARVVSAATASSGLAMEGLLRIGDLQPHRGDPTQRESEGGMLRPLGSGAGP